MNFSYWENKHLIGESDFTIIGAGITGLTTAIFLKKKYPKKSIQILERGVVPWGASTKNAGFACFGSISEILSDMESVGEQKTIELVEQRWKGLLELRSLLNDQNIGIQKASGYELFTEHQLAIEKICLDRMEDLNHLLYDIFQDRVFSEISNVFGFNGVRSIVKNQFEAQVDTGLMMKNLIRLVEEVGVHVMTGAKLESFNSRETTVDLVLEGGMLMRTKNLVLCSNGFTSKLKDLEVKPARAQVLITKPIDNLKIKGSFHLEEGYYYFRNIDNRVLFGGGRNLDLEGEETMEMENSDIILNQLKEYLDKVILPNTNYEIDYTWAGIMGVGSSKSPIIRRLEENVYCGVRLGGMGVAIGTLVGKELSELIEL